MKTVLITGANGGIGQAIALSFAKENYNVICQYNKNETEAKNLKDKLDKINANYLFIKADISSPDEVLSMIKSSKENFTNIDVLINNAGIALQKLITETSTSEWLDVINVDLNGTFYVTKEVLKDMIHNHSGNIINISSMWGEVGASCEVAYSTAKAGIIGFTKALAKEVGPSNINVNAITPGVIKTHMLDCYTEEDLNNLKYDTPLSRLGTPEDIANACLFLSSEKASFITGQILGVNGGFII